MGTSEITMPTLTLGVRRERAAFPCMLRQVEGPGAPRWIRLDRAELVLGRSEDADIRVETQRASRKHATFETDHGECTILDHKSRNGVLLNGVRIHSAVLRDKDVVQIADCVFLFHDP
jgi:pSer/pThr/pTyr-binding forkhead associated (FHA) protein